MFTIGVFRSGAVTDGGLFPVSPLSAPSAVQQRKMNCMRRFSWLLPLCCLLTLAGARADQEASNTLYVKTSQYGNCYVKSVPLEPYSTKGRTNVYGVRPGDDVLLHTFNWYSQTAFIECNVVRHPENKVSVVRMGRWPSGRRANAQELAIAFYYGGNLVRQYSTLDIAGLPDNVTHSVSHYRVISEVYGYFQQKDYSWTFELLTIDGRRLAFDPSTGNLLSARKQ